MHDNCGRKEAHKTVKVWVEKRLQTKLHPSCFIWCFEVANESVLCMMSQCGACN